MPLKLEGMLGRKDMIRLDPKEVDADQGENFSRFASVDNETDLAADLALAESIIESGQLQPVVISKVNNRAKLRAGFRRLRVIRDIVNPRLVSEGKEPLPLFASFFDGNEDDGFIANIEENVQRKNLTPMDVAVIVRRLANHYGKTDEQIAKMLGVENGKPRTTAWVSQHRSLLTLDYDTQLKVHTGELALSSALLLVGMTTDDRKKVIEKAIEITKADEPPVVAAPPVAPVQTVTVVEGDTAPAPPVAADAPVAPPAKATKIKPKAVAAAAREVTGKSVSRTLKDVKDVLTKYVTDNYAFPSESMLDFIEGKIDEDALVATAIIPETEEVG